MEGAEEFLLKRLRQTDFRRKRIMEIGGHGFSVHPLRSRGQAKQYRGVKMREYGAIAVRCAVMNLIDHDIIIEIVSDLPPELAVRQHLD